MIPPSPPPQSEPVSGNQSDDKSESAGSGVSNIRFHVTVEEGDDDDDMNEGATFGGATFSEM